MYPDDEVEELDELRAENKGLRILFEILLREIGGTYTFSAARIQDALDIGTVLVRQDNPDGSLTMTSGTLHRVDSDMS